MRQCGLEKTPAASRRRPAPDVWRRPLAKPSFLRTRMANPADSSASPTSPQRRAGATKARPSTVSSDTEDKLARAARSAQRLAQLSDVPADDSTLDLFPDDPTRATLQAMNIDVRQGTLSGFELPGAVRVAIGATDDATATAETKTVRRASRPARTEDDVPAPDMWSGEPASASVAVDADADATALPVAARDAAGEEADGAASSSMAAASVVRSVAALRQISDESSAPTTPTTPANGKPPAPPQRFAATFAKAASASREAGASAGSQHDAPPVADVPPAPTAFRPPPPSTSHDTIRDTPELDRARATAFADTVDALYGVIADQRRAALDHSRRMKWMLSIVVGALLVTVVVGIAQTLLLMRLARNTTFQQQRIEQMMLNQQATLATLLDTDSATVSAPAVTPPTPAAAAPSRPAAAARHPARTQHAHKPKPANSH
ncbi:hypothetical protein [Paraburkholderia sp.]|uniref:hypothetical protein n=1 Tax=Paraburkholderia sp. TaxID=1926495 RepID=UPI003D6F3161